MTVRTAVFYPVSHSDLVLLFILDGVKKIEIETHPLDRLPWPGRRWEVSLAGSRPHPDWGWWELESERRHKLERIDWKSSELPVSESFWLDFNTRTFNGPQGLKQRQIYIKNTHGGISHASFRRRWARSDPIMAESVNQSVSASVEVFLKTIEMDSNSLLSSQV